ncbi:FecCD family ABC transporter permease [Spirosoma aerolatum]|uniref:FecCD family ABC transporter permease n=1 Tax=Spirosoma aerolatum TaxID=1211326 RepID=UPI0009AD2F2A|nr:iron ABC transporter permease [Spirosoma aerolatum]
MQSTASPLPTKAIPEPLIRPSTTPRRVLVFSLISLGVIGVFLLEISIGAVSIPVREIIAALTGTAADDSTGKIIMELRLPRALAALLGGAALGVAGMHLQTVFRNPLAEPWSLGLMAGSQLGVALVVTTASVVGSAFLEQLAFLSNLSIVAGSALGCILVLLLMVSVSRYVNTVTLLVFGLMLGFLSQGLVSIILHFTNQSQGKVFAGWNDGSFAGVFWEQLPYLALFVGLGLAVSIALVKPLNALLLGETYAHSLGLNLKTTRIAILSATVLLTAPVTSYCGPILFLGMIIPHLTRGLFGTSDHRVLLPGVIGVGALIAMSADLMVHLPWERHFLHLNAIAAVLGAPVVMWIILRNKRMRSL